MSERLPRGQRLSRLIGRDLARQWLRILARGRAAKLSAQSPQKTSADMAKPIEKREAG
jgi:hypothetical protein